LTGTPRLCAGADFDNILRKVSDKARRRQAGEHETGGPMRLLIADLSTGG
jgi:hypothetical protein